MENKHKHGDLEQMQSLPLEAKIRMTQSRIRAWYEAWDGKVYVSVSGGKDSQVLAHIVREQCGYKDVPLIYIRTGLEYSSVDAKGEELADEIIRPEKDFQSVIKQYGYPVIGKELSQKIEETRSKPDGYASKSFNGQRDERYDLSRYKYLLDAPFRISHQCCNQIKKKPAKSLEKSTGRKPYIATMAEESRARKSRWIKQGCNAFEKKRPTSQPLSFWTEQDILQYIKKFNLKIADIYGNVCYQDDDGMYYDNPMFNESMKLTTTGAKRTGCVFCLFGITQDTERLLKLKSAEPKKYDFVMRGGKFDESGLWIPDKGLGYKFVVDWLNEHGNLNIKY